MIYSNSRSFVIRALFRKKLHNFSDLRSIRQPLYSLPPIYYAESPKKPASRNGLIETNTDKGVLL